MSAVVSFPLFPTSAIRGPLHIDVYGSGTTDAASAITTSLAAPYRQ